MFEWDKFNYTPQFSSNQDEEQGGGGRSSSTPTQGQVQRTFFDRVLAPFEAPQQFLFSLTQGVAEDGFQGHDIWNALSHGARYFNPWSNEERIDDQEIADIFFGRDEDRNPLAQTAMNLGVALLFDPLWAVPVAKLARAPASAVKTIDRVTNPASVLLEGLAAGGKVAGKTAANLAKQVPGYENFVPLGQTVASLFTDRFAGIPQEFKERILQFSTEMQEYRIISNGILKRARGMSKDGQRLLSEAIESGEYRNLETLNIPTPKLAASAPSELLSKIDAAGVEREFFFETLQDLQKVNMDIESRLLKTGLLSEADALEMGGRHLRRMYINLDHPTDMRRRLDKLVERTKGLEKYEHLYESRDVFDRVKLRESLMAMSDELGTSLTDAGRAFQDSTLLKSSVRRRYFPEYQGGGGRRFNADNFVDDFGKMLDDNPDLTISEAMSRIFDGPDSLIGGVSTPDGFKEVLSNYMAKGMVSTHTVDDWYRKLDTLRVESSVSFRSFRQNFDVLASREAIPDEIAREVLGRVDAAVPRTIEQVLTAGRQAFITELLDDLSGAKRMTQEMHDLISTRMSQAVNRAYSASKGGSVAGSSAPRNMSEIYGQFKDDPGVIRMRQSLSQEIRGTFGGGDLGPLQRIVDNVVEGSLQAGDEMRWYTGRGDALATRTKGGSNTIRLEGDTLGSLNGMYVSPTVAMHVQQYSTIMRSAMGKDPRGIAQMIGSAVESLTANFKFLKIPMDASAHVRDLIGSLISMDMMGVTPFKVSNWKKAMEVTQAANRGEIHPVLQSAHAIGYDLFGSTLSATHLRQSSLRGAQAIDMEALDWVQASAQVFQRGVLDRAGRVTNKMAEIYQGREQVLRTYVYTNKHDELVKRMVDAGRTPDAEDMLNIARQSAEAVNKTLFNYADVPLAVEFARKYGVAPFLTFPLKATGQLANALYTDPLRVLKYDRGLDGWNEHWAGGEDAYAREVQDLPRYQREAMVVRLPWENTEGNPLYLDLSYFIPWAAVRDLTEDVMGLGTMFKGLDTGDFDGPAGVAGTDPQRSGVLSPVLTQLYSALATGEDGLGRRLWDERGSTEDKVKGISKFLWQFMAPPTFMGGGATADSVGRAIIAAARTSDEPVNWVEMVGRSMRFGWEDEDVLNRYGEAPTSRALPTLTDNPIGQVGLGLTSLFMPVSEVNPYRQARNEGFAVKADVDEFKSDMRNVMSNPNLSPEKKQAELQRLMALTQARIRAYNQWQGIGR